LLEVCGEECYLLQRKARAKTTFQWASREVDVLTTTTAPSAYTADPETGYFRYLLWNEATDSATTYPDIGVMTVTVQATGGVASVWEPAVDKYSFLPDRNEYAVDIFQDQLDSTGTSVPDAVYIVFNTPPFIMGNIVLFTYGNINPLVNFAGMQPIRDNQPDYQNSLFGFEQWLDPNQKIRSRHTPNAFLLAFPGVLSDFTITEGGLLQETKGDFWTTPIKAPIITEHDVVIRNSTGERYQVTNYTPIFLESILVSQHMDLTELDPRSSIYNVPIVTGL
jgi:hypothetical protein